MKRLTLGIGVAAAAAAGVGWTIARRLTAPVSPRAFDLTVHGVEHDNDGDLIVFDHKPDHSRRHLYWFEHGGWAQLSTGSQMRQPVSREGSPEERPARPKAGDRASWSGICATHTRPDSMRSITIDARQCPAWRIDGDPPGRPIHGLGHPPASSRSVSLTDLITPPRRHVRNTEGLHCRCHLGHTETEDVDEAIGYAVRRGARQIVLFGWSMGAAIALQLTDRPRHEGLIAALVLDSPVLDWTEVIKTYCTRSGLPATAAYLAIPWLTISRSLVSLAYRAALPIVRLDRQSRRPQHAHMILRRAGARQISSHKHPRQRPDLMTGDLRRRPHARLEHRTWPVARRDHRVALSPSRRCDVHLRPDLTGHARKNPTQAVTLR